MTFDGKLNVNGLRAALRNYAEHLANLKPDAILLQEIRAFPEHCPKTGKSPKAGTAWHPAEKQATLASRRGRRTSTKW